SPGRRADERRLAIGDHIQARIMSMDNVDQLGVLLYGACTGIRSSRQIKRRRQKILPSGS
ncbi:MAG TPA: hypothetical protein VHJ58_08715, partial [Vicinamibacterales bacterium]|nr:hypothetical protein [Vicinamibacterales bacterium]